MLGEQTAETIIRSALDRWRGEPHFQRSIVFACDCVAARAWLHPDTKPDSISIHGYFHLMNAELHPEGQYATLKI